MLDAKGLVHAFLAFRRALGVFRGVHHSAQSESRAALQYAASSHLCGPGWFFHGRSSGNKAFVRTDHNTKHTVCDSLFPRSQTDSRYRRGSREGATPAPENAKPARTPKAKKEAGPKKLSAIDAAAKVLAEDGQALSSAEQVVSVQLFTDVFGRRPTVAPDDSGIRVGLAPPSPNWLYGVARQTAVRVLATAAKRRRREKQVVNMPPIRIVAPPGTTLLIQELAYRPY